MMEEITHVAIKYAGKVYSLPRPNRHHHVIRKIRHETGDGLSGPDIQGFLTDADRFLNRREAYELATANGQLNRSWHPPGSYAGKELYSEDLWKDD